jgi:hypothetical protein
MLKKGRQMPSPCIVEGKYLPMVIVVRMTRVCIDYARAKGGGYDEADDDEFNNVERFHYSSF